MSYKYIDINYKLNTSNQDIQLSYESEAINNSIRNILLTAKGTLPGNPNFGTNIEDVLFEILDEITLDYLRNIIYTELQKQEPRINVMKISFSTNIDEGQILAKIEYLIVNTNDIESTLVKISI